ncbi:hypothetical protein [Alicyclobacillus acidoterrestris]|uniref:Uncharacterized protein n=1 Tax=Alicyclobacillus acidoterrestris (strain ATCC 49025 / DSM 3922 / CIP 106132 / NCIMB 13137 / GD3B) TaxID=1356854 RepID=T0D7B9_ALIAG|nr:hypothetical protein [Alicyclobacillus acidoterrestris]EPZ47397.1 hypothetical protein N007_06190 [Alicyclobacillus acidoterrestris ATCC 49025]UNO48296.1 hypothetical protein K1I37_16715 [Alicyclobacillus acidoterrestris]
MWWRALITFIACNVIMTLVFLSQYQWSIYDIVHYAGNGLYFVSPIVSITVAVFQIAFEVNFGSDTASPAKKIRRKMN